MSSIRRKKSPIATVVTVVSSLAVSALVAVAVGNWVPWFSRDAADASAPAVTAAPAPSPTPRTSGLTPYQGDGFTISYMDLPEGSTFDLDAGVQGSAQNVGGTIAQSVPGKLVGYPSRETQIVGVTKYGPEATVWGSYSLIGNRVYMILLVAEGKNAPRPAEFDQVRQSFGLTKAVV